jgi:hypothetical protein
MGAASVLWPMAARIVKRTEEAFTLPHAVNASRSLSYRTRIAGLRFTFHSNYSTGPSNHTLAMK